MIHASALSKRATSLFAAGVLASAALVPVLLISQASAFAQLNERQIDIYTSEVSAADVVYTVSFEPATTGNIRTIIVDFCDSPLIGTVCNAPAGLDSNEAGLGVYNETGSGFGTAWAVDTGESTANKVVIKDAAGTSVTAGNTVSFDLGNGTTGNGIDNPSTLGSFYARILTYATDTAGDSYDSSSTGSNNAPAATVDAGGVALSTANQLTINARVQEVLQFCVGTDDAASADDCTDISGTTVDIGVIQSGSVSISPVATTAGGNNRNGLAMVRTNAVNGVVIDYFAESTAGDTGTNHLASLRVEDATCAGDGTIATGAKTDQCFNSAGTTQAVFASTDEGFGMTVSGVDVTNGTTNNLVRDVEYDGDGTNGGGNGWAWAQGTPDRIASSTGSGVKVVDDELLTLRFAAQAAVTTPTGQYGVLSTYIATSSF
jgi:hypothetical protein